jgi:hypothetical protein
MNLDKYQYEILEMNIRHLDNIIKQHNETEISVNN